MEVNDTFQQFHDGWAAINTIYEKYARNIGVSYAFLQVLCKLYEVDGVLTQKEICARCQLPKTTVNAIINGFDKNDYVGFKAIPTDKRQKGIFLTVKGKKYAEPIMTKMRASEQKAFATLDSDTVEKMIQGIDKYQQAFNQYLNDEGE